MKICGSAPSLKAILSEVRFCQGHQAARGDGAVRAKWLRALEPTHTERPPGVASLHSHAFQRGMAGLAETRGSGSDRLLVLAAGHVPLRRWAYAEDLEAIAGFAFMEMLEAGFTAVGEFHTSITTGMGVPSRAEMCARIAAAATTGIGLYSCRPFMLMVGLVVRRRERRSGAFYAPDRFLRLLEGARTAVSGLPMRPLALCPIRCARSRPTRCTPWSTQARKGPSTSTRRSSCAKRAPAAPSKSSGWH